MAVIGLGMIGGSLLQYLRGDGIGWDIDAHTRALAIQDGYDVVASLQEAVKGVDAVLVAVPLAARENLLVDITRFTKALVLDLSSVQISTPGVVSAHPMMGSTKSGWEGASEYALHGARWSVDITVLCHQTCLMALRVITRLSGHVYPCSAERHNELVARSSHAAHALSWAYTHCSPPDMLDGPGYRSVTRLAHASSDLWADILFANSGNTTRVLDDLQEQLRRLQRHIEQGDRQALRLYIDESPVRCQCNLKWSEHRIDCVELVNVLCQMGRDNQVVRYRTHDDNNVTVLTA